MSIARMVLGWISIGLAMAVGLVSGCASVSSTGPVGSTPNAGVESAAPQAVEPSAPPAPSAQPEPEAPLAAHVNLQEFVERNDDKLLQVYVGMSRQSVERLMGGLRSGAYSNPFRQQAFSLAGGKRYEVLYYLTRTPQAGRGITEVMLTPVILRDDRIVAIGRYPLKKLRRGECPGKPGACQ
jgi:hypothetical protein